MTGRWNVECRRDNLGRRALALLLVWACLTGVLIAVGVWVTHSSSVNAFDRHVTSVVVAHRTPALNSVMKALTWLGSWVALLVTGILLVVLALRRRLPAAAVLVAIVAWGGESGGVTLAKHVVQRSRPPPDLRLVSAHGWSWPSGHTAAAIVVFVTVALIVTGIPQTRRTESSLGCSQRSLSVQSGSRGSSWGCIGAPMSSPVRSLSSFGSGHSQGCSCSRLTQSTLVRKTRVPARPEIRG